MTAERLRPQAPLEQSATPRMAASVPVVNGRPGWAPVVAILAGVAAAWIAAGSAGLLSHGLRHVLTWCCLGVSIVAVWPDRWLSWSTIGAGFGLLAAVAMNALDLPVANTLSVAVVLAMLSVGRPIHVRRVLAAVASAVLVFAVYRLAVTSVPWLWLGAESVSGLASWGVGRIGGHPLAAGPSFAGLDFVVLMAALLAGWSALIGSPRRWRVLYAALAILGGHLTYLVALAVAPVMLAAGAGEAERLSGWLSYIASLVPWNIPILALAIHLCVAGAMFRWCVDLQPAVESEAQPRRKAGWLTGGVAGLLALAIPALAVLFPTPLSLEGKKVVAYKEGFLNWLRPVHGEYGRLSVGMYGMLDPYVRSLGGEFLISPDLSEQDLAEADVLILLYPNQPWAAGQAERIWSFVRRGGSLLLMGDHTTRHADVPLSEGGNYFNQLLAPTHMRIRFDSATFAVGGWLQSYAAMNHPTTVGIADDRNQFGVVIGSSVEARWPARPLLMGQYGWADPGDEGSDAAMMGNHRYDPGELLGDLVVAAEEPIGAGKVIVFGDTSSMTNGINVGAHVFTSRLLAYLAGARSATPAWRQVMLLVCAGVLIVLVIGSAGVSRLVLVSLGLCVSMAACKVVTARAATLLPDGTRVQPNNLAYIDTSHLPAHSEESWREEGVGGLVLTLMRNGYLTLNMEEFSSERLARAGLLFIGAPSREYSASEREAIHRFVEQGGIVICTVGYERFAAARTLLRRFELFVGLPDSAGPGTPDPTPLGHFKSPYIKVNDYMAHVRFHAAWPVGTYADDTGVLAFGAGDRPVMVMRRIGKGKFVLIGDTGFAMNRNLEREGGEPFEGMRENADFWRWLLAYLAEREPWLPSGSQAPAETRPAP